MTDLSARGNSCRELPICPAPASPAVFIGTAGWSIPKNASAAFDTDGSHLQRYAVQLNAAEINSSFHRPHRASTYERWCAAVPQHFRFSVKVPKQMTHVQRLLDCEAALDQFCAEVSGLAQTLAVLLVQLPPSLQFEPGVAESFLAAVRGRSSAAIALEPRHASWFGPEADEVLRAHCAARVAADPARIPEAALPGGWNGLIYYRLHGAPRMYYSKYSAEFIESLSSQIHRHAAAGIPCWCIFDNTAGQGATQDALALLGMLQADAGWNGT